MTNSPEVKAYLQVCGHSDIAVRVLICLGRCFWRVNPGKQILSGTRGRELATQRALVDMVMWRSAFAQEMERSGVRYDLERLDTLFRTAIKALIERGVVLPVDGDAVQSSLDLTLGEMSVALAMLQPSSVCEALLRPALDLADIRYRIRREKLERYGLQISPYLVRAFHLLASHINAGLHMFRNTIRLGNSAASGLDCPNEGSKVPTGTLLYTYQELFTSLLRVLEEDLAQHETYISAAKNKRTATVKLFVEACVMTQVVRVYPALHGESRTMVGLPGYSIDAETLISNVFGIPTSIGGFDELFGGGGIILANGIAGEDSTPPLGRMVFIRGRSGIGKSLLSLQLAMEVARRGGTAWVYLLEQMPNEALHALEATFHRDLRDVTVLLGNVSASKYTEAVQQGRGVLALVTIEARSVRDFLIQLEDRARGLSRIPLRLIVVDPINTARLDEGISKESLRQDFLKSFVEIKKLGGNLLVVGEESAPEHPDELSFVENISDTVIALTMESGTHYTPKYFEVRKSRLQREQRGLHPYSIVPGVGYRILPSTAAVSARLRSQRPIGQEIATRFGVAGLDRLLSDTGLHVGDVVVLAGQSGCWRKAIGLAFLLTTDRGPLTDDVLVSSGGLLLGFGVGEHYLRGVLEEDYVTALSNRNGRRSVEQTILAGVQSGYISAGHVFRELDDRFRLAHERNLNITRVLVLGLSEIEHSFPLLARDTAFVSTLLEYLRRKRVTTLYVTQEQETAASGVSAQVIVNGADVLVEVSRSKHPLGQIEGQIVRAHGSKFQRDRFRVSLSMEDGVDIAALG